MANEGLTQVRNLWQTQLTADVSSSATTLPVVSTSGMPTTGIVVCGREAIYYSGLTGTSFTGCIRGLDSTATAHAKGGRVRSAPVAAHHNDVVGALGAGGITTAMLAAHAVTQAAIAVGSSSGPTTTSGSFVDATDMSVTLNTTGGDVLVWWSSAITLTVHNNVYVGLKVDAAADVATRTVTNPGASDGQLCSTMHLFTGLAAGSHTFKGRWAVAAGTGALYTTDRSIIVLELKR